MPAVGQIAAPLCQSSTPISPSCGNYTPKNCLSVAVNRLHSAAVCRRGHSFSTLSLQACKKIQITRLIPMATALSSVEKPKYTEEPATNVKFLTSVDIPGCPSSMSLLGTGVRDKSFAIISVKVYAAGLYVNPSIFPELNPWKGKSAAEIQKDSLLFQTLHQSPSEISLLLVLARDLDGKTFWDALNSTVSPRVPSPTPDDQSAFSTFQSLFQGQSMKKGTNVFLTWVEPSKMLVSIGLSGLPTKVDATVQAANVPKAIFDVYFGDTPVSPSLKASAAKELATIL